MRVALIVELNERARRGEREAAAGIRQTILWLAWFCLTHIRREDRTSFLGSERSFDEKELDEMLEGFRASDADMIHNEYREVFESLKA